MTQKTNTEVCIGRASSTSFVKKLKTQPSAGKVMLAVFWNSRCPILEY
jgi:hypothetical protein